MACSLYPKPVSESRCTGPRNVNAPTWQRLAGKLELLVAAPQLLAQQPRLARVLGQRKARKNSIPGCHGALQRQCPSTRQLWHPASHLRTHSGNCSRLPQTTLHSKKHVISQSPKAKKPSNPVLGLGSTNVTGQPLTHSAWPTIQAAHAHAHPPTHTHTQRRKSQASLLWAQDPRPLPPSAAAAASAATAALAAPAAWRPPEICRGEPAGS